MSPRKHSVLAAPLFSASTLGRWTWKRGERLLEAERAALASRILLFGVRRKVGRRTRRGAAACSVLVGGCFRSPQCVFATCLSAQTCKDKQCKAVDVYLFILCAWRVCPRCFVLFSVWMRVGERLVQPTDGCFWLPQPGRVEGIPG